VASVNKPMFRLEHIGINAESEKQAGQIADTFCKSFGFLPHENPEAIFCDNLVEVVKKNGRGTKGHICFSVDSIVEALEYLRKEKGIGILEESKKYTEAGRLRLVYLDYDFFGFAVHLKER